MLVQPVAIHAEGILEKVREFEFFTVGKISVERLTT